MKVLLWLAASMLPLVCHAEFVVPLGSVDEYVNVRMVPDAKSEIVGRLYQGTSARLVRDVGEWHEIEIAGGATGFISSDWTVIVGDAAPTAPVVKEPASKNDVVELTPEEAMAALANLEPVTFTYELNDPERHVGFAPGNVPELVASTESEGLRPLEIVAVLTRIVKLQQEQIASLQARLEERN